MSVQKTLALLMMIGAVSVSCLKDPEASPHSSPEILDTSVEVLKSAVLLSCQVSKEDNITECGFYFGLNETQMTKYIADLPEGHEFSFNISGLTCGEGYFFRSFVSGGDDTRLSVIKRIEISQRLPSVSIKSLTMNTQGNLLCEYSVTDDFSGELFVQGLCWDVSGTPTIQKSEKVMAGTDYGSFTGEICTLQAGRKYHFRAFAINSMGIAYSEEAVLNTPAPVENENVY